jgi:hypothetical protein
MLSLIGAAALGLALAGCNNASFAGPPQGSSLSGRGLEPLVGATPFTFEPEMRVVTGFSVDHWFVHAGTDSNDGFNQQPVAWCDGLDALKDAGFKHFITNNNSQQASNPLSGELNVQFPMTVSFMCQWFFRNADNSRPLTYDVFGRQVYSDAALDISLITAEVVEVFSPPPPVLIAVSYDADYPSRGPAGIDVPLKGWTTPPTGDPSAFPPSRQVFTASQYNTLAMIVVKQVSAGGGGGATGGGTSSGGTSQLALGAALADDRANSYVETMNSVPSVNPFTGGQVAVLTPVGCFGDNYALAYRQAPVKQPPQVDPNGTPPRFSVSINDPDLEEALIEFSRHMGSVYTNLIGQAIGLSPSAPGTLMDPAMAKFQNRYEYRFAESDIDLLANTVLPGRYR